MLQQSDAVDSEQTIQGSEAQEMEQILQTRLGNVDLEVLTRQLSELRAEMRRGSDSPECDIAVGSIAAAEEAIKREDTAKALEHLKNAGRWSLKVAEGLGVGVAVAALKTALGI